MKTCKKCCVEFKPEKGLINYCSLKCRNSRNWSEKDKIKKSISAKNSDKLNFINQNRTKEVYKKITETRKKNHIDKILNSNYEDLSYESLRFRILYEQEEKCNKCDLNMWLGEKLTLELEHKDGNHHNNNRENLELLCPNCHSLTVTWRGRNKQNNKNKVSDFELLNSLLINEWNIRQSLINVGLAPKGGNYVRCNKLKKEITTCSSIE